MIPEKGDKLNFPRDAKILNDTLLLRTFLTGKELSVADYICWAYIRDSKSWNSNEGEKMVNLTRWFNHVAQMEPIKKAELAAPKMTDKGAVKEVKVTAAGRKQEGTFVELEGAKMGEVVTRFPPKASDFFILVMQRLVYSMHIIRLHSRLGFSPTHLTNSFFTNSF